VKVSCLQENLARGLSIVGRAVASRSTLPVLGNVMLSTDGGRLKLSATNLEIGINCWVGAKVQEEGATTVPARLLIEFVNSLPPEQIDMELTVRTQELNLRCAHFEANIKGIDAQEFPIIPTSGDGEAVIHLERGSLRRMIDQVAFAAATDESRPILTGVLVKFEADQLVMAAADGFRLSVRTEPAPELTSEPISVIIPARALTELARITAPSGPMVEGEEDFVEITITPARNQILFHMKDIDLVSQLIEGNFPDYNQIIPKEYNSRAVLDVASFLKAGKVSFLFARESANIVRLQIEPGGELSPGHLIMSATSAELGSNVGEIDATVEGEPIEIAFNARYLIDILSVINTAQVILETTNSSSPGLLRPVGDQSFIHVVMPMHLSK
jgi:DNA polymerase-3 subunit beta